MKLYKYTLDVVDRDDESDEIKNDLIRSLQTRVHIIYSETAIGKSSLTKKVRQVCQNDSRHIISVKTNPENSTTNASDWVYIDKIFNCINQYFTSSESQHKFSFNNYINNIKDKSLKKLIFENALDHAGAFKSKFDLLFNFLYYWLRKIFHLKEFNSESIADSNSYNSRMIKARYIQYIMLNTNIFLTIDNIQNVDSVSWNFLLNWLNMSKSKRHYIILEYTLSSNYTFEKMLTMIEQISDTGVQISFSELEKLSEEYVVDIVEKHFMHKPQDLEFNINLLKHYRTNSNGNLRQIIDYTIRYTPEKKENKSPTADNLINLHRNSKYIFAILANCNGEIYLQTLKELLYQMQLSEDDISVSLDEMREKEIVNIESQKVSVVHASLIDSWKDNSSSFKEFNTLAYHRMEKYFTNLWYSDSAKGEKDYAWVVLLQLYAEYNPYKIQVLLKEINEKINNHISPSTTWKYLSLLIESSKDKIANLQEMYFQILQICFQMELYEEGYSCLCIMEKYINIFHNTKLLLFKAMYLSALDMHQDNIVLYESFVPLLDKNSRTYFNLNMIVLCSYRSLNNYQKCRTIHKELYSKHKLMNEYDYAIFMRLTNIYLSDDKALKYARKSMRYFSKLNKPDQEAKSIITYSKLLSGLGHNRKAVKLILKAEQLSADIYMGRHMIYNNQAAFLLMQGKYDNNILFLLNQAECSAIVPYDKLSIIVNKLVWSYENSQYDMLDLLTAKAKSLIPTEPDEHVHILIYYNLYLIYKQKGDEEKSNYYYNLAYINRNKCKFVQARFDNTKSKEMKWRLKHPWHVCYLSFWTYDLDADNLLSDEYKHSS